MTLRLLMASPSASRRVGQATTSIGQFNASTNADSTRSCWKSFCPKQATVGRTMLNSLATTWQTPRKWPGRCLPSSTLSSCGRSITTSAPPGGYISSAEGWNTQSTPAAAHLARSASSGRGYLDRSSPRPNWVGLTKMLTAVAGPATGRPPPATGGRRAAPPSSARTPAARPAPAPPGPRRSCAAPSCRQARDPAAAMCKAGPSMQIVTIRQRTRPWTSPSIAASPGTLKQRGTGERAAPGAGTPGAATARRRGAPSCLRGASVVPGRSRRPGGRSERDRLRVERVVDQRVVAAVDDAVVVEVAVGPAGRVRRRSRRRCGCSRTGRRRRRGWRRRSRCTGPARRRRRGLTPSNVGTSGTARPTLAITPTAVRWVASAAAAELVRPTPVQAPPA